MTDTRGGAGVDDEAVRVMETVASGVTGERMLGCECPVPHYSAVARQAAAVEFAREQGITETGALVFIELLWLLRNLPDRERLDVIALIAKCHVEPALRKVAFP